MSLNLFHKSIVKWLSLPILLLTQASIATEKLDIETLASHRTKQYPLAPYDHIVIFSGPRTGSSVTYNIFHYLFEKEENLLDAHQVLNYNRHVIKTHRVQDLKPYEDRNVLYVVTLRHPVDACSSHYRIVTRQITNLDAFTKMSLQLQTRALLYAEELLSKGCTVLFLKYEEFENDLTYLLSVIDEQFGIQIDPNDRETILNGYNKNHVLESIKNLSNFSEYLPVSGFHGTHVSRDTYVPDAKFLDWLNLNLREIKPIFERHGYRFDKERP